MTLAVVGLGTAVPPLSLPQCTSAKWAVEVSGTNGRRRLIPALFRRSGVRRRHSVVLEGRPARQTFFPPARHDADGGPGSAARMERYRREAPILALRAARMALQRAFPPDRGAPPDPPASHLVTVSCTGFSAPGFDVALVGGLGLEATTPRVHVGFMGCHGALNGLRVARALLEADPAARVLLCAVELCSLHYDYGGAPERLVANAIFSDGAAAMLATRGDGPWHLAHQGSCIFPGTEDLMTWAIGDHGFAMGLSPRVPGAIARHLRPWLEAWLAEAGMSLADIGSWAIHPGGPRILDAVETALDLGPEALADARSVLQRYGNMSSPTVLFVLDRLRRRDAPRPCLALGFGPGLTAEAALFL